MPLPSPHDHRQRWLVEIEVIWQPLLLGVEGTEPRVIRASRRGAHPEKAWRAVGQEHRFEFGVGLGQRERRFLPEPFHYQGHWPADDRDPLGMLLVHGLHAKR